MRDAVTEFLNYNRPFAERNPDLYRVKIARMAENPFAFLRGSFHLFAKDVIDNVAESVGLLASDGGVEMDLVGDIHSENYGTYQATDTDVYYDINDFDETIRGRLDFDVCRLAVSLLLMSQNRGDSLADTVRVTLTGITTYTEALPNFLKKGKEALQDL